MRESPPPLPVPRLVIGVALALVYAAPLFWPPPPEPPGTAVGSESWLLERVVPGVPAVWVALRVAALAIAAVLLSSARAGSGLAASPSHGAQPDAPSLAVRLTALALALAQIAASPLAPRLGTLGQCTYLAALFLPAALLARPWRASRPHVDWRRAAPLAGIVAAWVLVSLDRDVQSPRVADVVDGWLGFLASASFATQHKNMLTDAYHSQIPGAGGVTSFVHGAPLFALGLANLTLARVQLLQIAWVAASACGLAYVGRALAGSGAGVVAAAVLLFAPFTRFASLFPGPFIVGPVYAVALAVLVVRALRRPSNALVAALGATAGVALTWPAVIPAVAFFGLVAGRLVVRHWRMVWCGALAAMASFAAAVLPLFPNVITPHVLAHVRWQGASAVVNDAALIGQIGLRAHQPITEHVVSRPFDVVVGALLAPFAHLRFAVRLFGDAIFDPVGATLAAVGLVSCLRAARCSPTARALLLFFLAALSPAFASPLDVVDITHALVLPVAVALLAAVGWRAVAERVRGLGRWAPACAALAAVAGTLLFDVVTPRIISASSPGIMFAVLDRADTRRAVLVGYDPALIPWARELFQSDIARWAGPEPVTFLPYAGGRFPRQDLPDEGKDLVFWSPGMHGDYELAAAVCRRWPDATLYEIWDRAHLGRTYAALVGAGSWTPRAPAERWRTWDCAEQRRQPHGMPP